MHQRRWEMDVRMCERVGWGWNPTPCGVEDETHTVWGRGWNPTPCGLRMKPHPVWGWGWNSTPCRPVGYAADGQYIKSGNYMWKLENGELSAGNIHWDNFLAIPFDDSWPSSLRTSQSMCLEDANWVQFLWLPCIKAAGHTTNEQSRPTVSNLQCERARPSKMCRFPLNMFCCWDLIFICVFHISLRFVCPNDVEDKMNTNLNISNNINSHGYLRSIFWWNFLVLFHTR